MDWSIHCSILSLVATGESLHANRYSCRAMKRACTILASATALRACRFDTQIATTEQPTYETILSPAGYLTRAYEIVSLPAPEIAR
jgi:hypothetical protein